MNILITHAVNKISHALRELTTRRSPRWDSVREAYLKKHPTCAASGSAVDVQVHHVKSFHEYPDLELDPANLISLSEAVGNEMHLEMGHTVNGKSSWKINNPNVREDAAKHLAAVINTKGSVL